MKSLFIVVLTVACVFADHDPGLRVTFGVGQEPGVDYFFDVPRTITEAIIYRWELITRYEPPPPYYYGYYYCHNGYAVCIHFDDTGNVVALQIALDQNDYTDNVYDMKVTGFEEWVVTTSSGEIRKFWTTTVYFNSEEYLQLPASEREASRNASKFLQEDAVWITGFNGVVEKISVEESEIQNTMFTRQACNPGMGRHYFYGMTKDSECRDDTIHPYFLLTDSEKLMAVGISIAGKLKINDGVRDWFERPSRSEFSSVVPEGPECLYNLAEDPGIITMHIYFIDKPWNIVCPTNE